MTTTTAPAVTLNEKPLELDNPFDDKSTLAETASIASNATTLYPSTLGFTPSKTLLINTQGIAFIRLPTPPSVIEIRVENPDGTLVYKSTRPKRSSGSCILTDAEENELIFTEYFWGPGRDPIIHILGNGPSGEKAADIDIQTKSPWVSRSHKVPLPSGSVLEWQYKCEKGFGGQDKKGEDKKGKALVCTIDGKRVAALIRNDETRTPGSKSCSGGNGGHLLLSEEVGMEKGATVSEEMLVATCLLMLKKERDRMRGYQAAAMSAVV